MGLLNDIYEDGVKWHDIACYHTKVRKSENNLMIVFFTTIYECLYTQCTGNLWSDWIFEQEIWLGVISISFSQM